MVLAVFSYRYDAELVPDLLANIEPMVDGWVAFDDRKAGEVFSNEPHRRCLLINRARELGATWVLAIDPDERIELAGATRIRGLTSERQRVVWEFNLREMFTASSYRVDGIWGAKRQGRLFPVFDGAMCSEQRLHGAWCVAPASYSILPSGLNLYHLKMTSYAKRLARRNLYLQLDPDRIYQKDGYDYLIDEQDAELEQIPLTRDFYPAHRESKHPYLHTQHVVSRPPAEIPPIRDSESDKVSSKTVRRQNGTMGISQLGQLRISVGKNVSCESKLAVVVIGFRAQKTLFAAVRSLIEQDTLSEIIVVNSGGGNISNVLREYLQFVVLVEANSPIYVGAARNLGIQVSRAPFVAFLAGDCMAAPGWVAERIQAHADAECAVGSVVENDKPRNPFAWAAHLMTYGHRMPGGTGGEAAGYGASYDRSFLDRCGYFSEAMIIGEDSEFHSRFRRSDLIWLHPSIRTIHKNPGGPISFVQEQFHRGLRGRYLADFLCVDFSITYIIMASLARAGRIVSLSFTRLHGKERLFGVCSWPLLPVAVISYFAGMIVSYSKAMVSEQLFRQATDAMVLGRPIASAALLRSAIQLRPVTPRYHEALGVALSRLRDYDSSARELYLSWDIDRSSIVDLFRSVQGRAASRITETTPFRTSIRLQVIVFSDSTVLHLVEFLKALINQILYEDHFDIFVVETHAAVWRSRNMLQVRQLYSHSVKFVSPERLMNVLTSEERNSDQSGRSLVVVSSSSNALPSNWLAVLRAYIITYPEIDVFQGASRRYEIGRTGFLERIAYDLGLFPHTVEPGGVLRFANATSWACNRSLLLESGGLTNDKMEPLEVQTLTQRVLKAGGSSLDTPDWQTRFRMDTTLRRLLGRSYQDGYYAAEHAIIMKDRDLAPIYVGRSGLLGMTAAAWQFVVRNFEVRRLTAGSLLLHVPALVLLILAAIARQIGWVVGAKGLDSDGFLRSQPIETR